MRSPIWSRVSRLERPKCKSIGTRRKNLVSSRKSKDEEEAEEVDAKNHLSTGEQMLLASASRARRLLLHIQCGRFFSPKGQLFLVYNKVYYTREGRFGHWVTTATRSKFGRLTLKFKTFAFLPCGAMAPKFLKLFLRVSVEVGSIPSSNQADS